MLHADMYMYMQTCSQLHTDALLTVKWLTLYPVDETIRRAGPPMRDPLPSIIEIVNIAHICHILLFFNFTTMMVF